MISPPRVVVHWESIPGSPRPENLNLIAKAEEVANELTEIPSFEIPEFDELFAEEKYVIKNLKKVFLIL